ncbi:uncharacterized protein LOC143297273 [Babylonia areolata]|uniref:uncharacterized protein LOC143297273 n=1 Tax=Babylonia areolata TaxID=304850 RepID=UPI003FD5CCE7
METMIEARSWSDLPELPPLCSAVSFRPALRQLHKQRKETAALRYQFYSRAEKRTQRQNTHSTNNGKITFHVDKTRRRDNHTLKISSSPAQSADTDRASARRWNKDGEKPTFPAITSSQSTKIDTHRPPRKATVTSPKQSPKNLEKEAMATNHARNDVKSPLAHWSVMAGRGFGTRSPSFRALTQLCDRPLPQLMEDLTRSYTVQPSFPRDLQAWQNEIVKVVPIRPGFVMPLGQQNDGCSKPHQSHRYPYQVLSLHPASHFYRSWSKLTDKEYVIHPEWSSERRRNQPRLRPR